jgi:Tol biopolymer transport system component
MKSKRSLAGGALALIFALPMLGAAPGFAAGSVELASRIDPSQASATASGGFPGNGDPFSAAERPSLSADGRYAVFLSAAANLAPGQRDVNGGPGEDGEDVFLADLVDGTVTLVSHAMGLPNTTGNQSSSAAVISADGRWVFFRSAATDLIPGQAGSIFNDQDLLLYDRLTGATTLVAATRQQQAYFNRLAISADGRFLTYDSDAFDLVPGLQGDDGGNVFLYDRTDGSTRLVSHVPGSTTAGTSDGGSQGARISADGLFVVFLAYGGGLLPGQSQDESAVLYDRVTGALTLVGRAESADLSADGKFVAFTQGPNLQIYSRETGMTTLVSDRAAAGSSFPQSYSLSADGRYLAFVQLTQPFGLASGVAVYDRVSRTTTAASRTAAPLTGYPTPPAISADGRRVVFASTDPAWVAGQTDVDTPDFNGTDVFLFDRAAGKTTLVSHAAPSPLTTGNRASYAPSISADGGRAVYLSRATDLVAGLADLNDREDLFAYDTATGVNRLATPRAAGLPSLSAALDSRATSLSADGRLVAFETFPFNTYAVPQADVRLYDPATKTTILVSHATGAAATPAKGVSLGGFLSPDGRWVAFYSNSRNLVPGANPGGVFCLFLFDRATGAVTFVARLGDDVTPDHERFLSTPRLSADGRFLAFVSDAANVVPGQQEPFPSASHDVFLFDRAAGKVTLVSHAASGPAVTGDSGSYDPLISADGRYVAFLSDASDLVSGAITEGSLAAYLYDRVTGTTALLSHQRSSPLAAVNVESNLAMSSDGHYIAFAADAGDLDPTATASSGPAFYVYDRVAGAYQRVAYAGGFRPEVALSADGRIVTFTGDYNVLPGHGPGLFFYDRVTKALSFASPAEVEPGSLALSGDGRAAVFESSTAGLVPGLIHTPGWDGTDIYLYDRTAGTTTLVNSWQGSTVTTAGYAYGALISADGRRVAFTSIPDLVAGDYNRLSDAYLFSLDGSTPGGPVTLPPCILFDTRRPANGPALRSNAARIVKATGTCGVPATAKRVTAKVTVFQETGKGNVRFYPGDLAAPSAGILRFSRGQTRSATFDLPLAPNGAGTLTLLPFVGGNGTVGVSVEIDGYTP